MMIFVITFITLTVVVAVVHKAIAEWIRRRTLIRGLTRIEKLSHGKIRIFLNFVLQVVSNAVTLMESSDIVWAHLHEVEMFSRGLFRLAPFPSCFYLRFETNLGSHPLILK